MYIVTKSLSLTLLFSYFFSDYLFASTKQKTSINTEFMSHASSLDRDKSRHVNKVVSRAHELIGTPYRWGGTSVSKGFDCSGLLVYLFRSEAGINIPRTTASMLNSKANIIPRHNLRRGDAVFFKHNGGGRMNHVGIYIGDNRFIHAPRAGKSIRIDSLSNSYWNKSYFSAKRFY
ncbi:Murein DD-endopeptidase MepH precursor [compost metagenome]